MRKFMNIFAAALVMLAAASCEKNEVLPDNNSEGKVVTLKASINNGGTKTSLGQGVWEEGDPKVYPVLWSEGDAIAVIQTINEETKIFKFVLQGQGKTAEGEFRLDVYDGCDYTLEENAFNASAGIQAFYPFEGISLDNNGKLNYTVPATQTYTTTVVNEVVCSTFGNGASPMAAYADNAADGLSFENLFGVVKLQLTGATGESLRCVEFVSDKAVSGSSIITINDESSSIILAETPNIEQKNIEQKKVVLECENPVELSTDQTAPTTVHIAVPGGVEHEFSVYIVTDKGAYYKKVSSAKEIVAGEIKKMGGLNLSGPEFEGKRMSYVENGVYLGEGVAIPSEKDSEGNPTKYLIWAPANCGYHADNFKYGKLYQWGRKYGQGYTGETEPEMIYGPVELEDGQNPDNANKFYKITSSPYDWVSPKSDALWNSGSVDAPVKTDYDPCPAGWRVPTNAELYSLLNGLTEDGYKSSLTSQWTNNSEDSNHRGLKGFWFYGQKENPSYTDPRVFFPAAGYRNFSPSNALYRDQEGNYWSSSVNGNYARPLHFDHTGYVTTNHYGYRPRGHSVRCVKD